MDKHITEKEYTEEDYRGLVHPVPKIIPEHEKETMLWAFNAAYEFAEKLRRKKEE